MRQNCLLLSAFTLALRIAGPALAMAAPPEPCPRVRETAGFQILSDRILPPQIVKAEDIRWASESSVYVIEPRLGSFEVSLAGDLGVLRSVTPGQQELGHRWPLKRQAVSSTHLAVGSMAFSIWWKRLDAKGFEGEHTLEYVADIDLFQDRLLVIGLRRDEREGLGADGNIAWIGSLEQGLADMRAVLPSKSGAGAGSMRNCAGMDLSAVRFSPMAPLCSCPGWIPVSSSMIRPAGSSAYGKARGSGSILNAPCR